MYLWHIFTVKPFAAMSVVICLATIFSLFSLERKRPHQKSDRFLIGFLGLLSIYEGMRVLQEARIVKLSMQPKMDDAIELLIACSYLIAALMLRLSSVSRLDAESAMRLAQAAPPRSSRLDTLEFGKRSAMETLNWAMPLLSDGAFKLYAFLWMRADYMTGRVGLGVNDMRLQLGKTENDLDEYLSEMQKAGAVAVSRQGGSVDIEILAHPARATSGPMLDEFSRSSRLAAPRA